jgi:aspartate oxidase
VVIATGGVGGLFLHSTNPRGAFGQGLAPQRCCQWRNLPEWNPIRPWSP